MRKSKVPNIGTIFFNERRCAAYIGFKQGIYTIYLLLVVCNKSTHLEPLIPLQTFCNIYTQQQTKLNLLFFMAYFIKRNQQLQNTYIPQLLLRTTNSLGLESEGKKKWIKCRKIGTAPMCNTRMGMSRKLRKGT